MTPTDDKREPCPYCADPNAIWVHAHAGKREALRLAMLEATTRDAVCPFCESVPCECEEEEA